MDASLLQRLTALNTAFAEGQSGAREQLLALTYQMAASLETPSDFISRTGWAEPARNACIRAAVDIKLFDALAEPGRASASTQDLSSSLNVDEALLARLLIHLSAMHVLKQVGPTEFAATNVSRAFVEPRYRDGLIYCYDVAGPPFRDAPTYLAKTGYKNPVSLSDGAFQHAHGTKSPFFAWLGENPKYLEAFGSYMSGYRAGKTEWHAPNFFPVHDKLAGAAPDQVLLVDVGGGMGHDLASFREQYPNLGKLVLQDQKDVIEGAREKGLLPVGVEATAHDFFTEQPVKNARAYYLHSILHDWDDESCVKILQNLAPALGEASVVLINEYVVPDMVGAAWGVTSMDMLMMVLGSVRERTAADFRRLLDQAGYVVEKIWSVDPGTESLLEARLKSR